MSLHRTDDRRVHLALKELLSGEQPPSLAERVRARYEQGEVVAEPVATEGHGDRRWLLVAAALLLGIGVVWGIARFDPSTEPVPTQGPEPLPPPTRATPDELDRLPDDVQHLVLYQPTDQDLARLARFRGLRALVIDKELGGARLMPVTVTDAGLQHLTKLTKLRVLHLHWCSDLTGAGLRHLESLPLLQELSLQGSNFADADLAALVSLRNLRSLVLTGVRDLRDESLEHVARLAGLQRLVLAKQTWLTPEGLVKLGALRQLRELDLNGVGMWTISSRPPPPEHARAGVDDSVLAVLGKLPDLEVLRISLAGKVTGKGLEHLRGLRKLHVLDLSYNSNVADPDLMAIQGSLEELKLDYCERITGHALSLFGDLRVLSLEGCGALEEGGFDEMPADNLRQLNLRYCRHLTGEIVGHLPLFPRLEKLDLGKCNWVQDEHLEAIARLKELRFLSLDGCSRVTDAGLAQLRELDGLEELDLRANPGVTADGILRLQGLPLRRLTVAACGRIDAGEIGRLQAFWPRCEIVR